MTERIRVENLSFTYGTENAPYVFQNLSFSVSRGELICFLGPNGTGKSTLLKCMNGILKPSGGEVYLDGDNLKSLSRGEIARKIGFVPQSQLSVFPFLVRDVVVMGRTPHMAMFSSPSRGDRAIAEEVMESIGISHLADKSCNMISGGEWQLVLIARALTQQPDILILDEPTSHLDMGNQQRILNVVHALAFSGLTVIMASHFPDHAFLGNSTVAVLKNGSIIARGAPDDVVTEEILYGTYGVRIKVLHVEEAGRKVCIPVMNQI
jgi:iron complex transport system ATP-binding protein